MLCQKYLDLGFTAFKVKVGQNLDNDKQRCKMVRESIGWENTMVRLLFYALVLSYYIIQQYISVAFHLAAVLTSFLATFTLKNTEISLSFPSLYSCAWDMDSSIFVSLSCGFCGENSTYPSWEIRFRLSAGV